MSRRRVVHLERVDGSLYCNATHRHGDLLVTSPRIDYVTCGRCLRKYLGLRITARVLPPGAS